MADDQKKQAADTFAEILMTGTKQIKTVLQWFLMRSPEQMITVSVVIFVLLYLVLCLGLHALASEEGTLLWELGSFLGACGIALMCSGLACAVWRMVQIVQEEARNKGQKG